MNEKSILREGNRRFAVGLFAIGIALCVCSGVNAQVKLPPPPKPLLLPDLVVSSLSAKFIAPNKVQYSWTITNVGTGPANLEGPTPANTDNLSVQAFVSKDTVYGNAGDVPAGGTIVGTSPLPKLDPGKSRSGTFTATVQANFTQLPHLVLKVDPGNAMAELNENNNTAAVGIGR
jgi:subtilase family serine protease